MLPTKNMADDAMFAVRILSTALVASAFLGWDGAMAQPAETTPHRRVDDMTKILLTIGDTEIVATLDDNATSKDFLSLLPMTLTLEDYSKTEKVSDLPKRLSTEGAPEGIDPAIGDITYYVPWGNLALFYRDFGYSRGLVWLGRIKSEIDVLEQPGPLSVTIERVD